MKRVLITGMSGAGKSSLLDELAARGHRTVDTDYGGYFHTVDGERLWREDRINALLGSAPNALPGVLFVQGTTRNQVLFYHRFNHIILLTARRPRSWPNGWPPAPPTPTGRIRPSSPRRSSTSRRWNRCCGLRPRSKWSPRSRSCGSPTSSSTTCGDPEGPVNRSSSGATALTGWG